MEIDKNFNNIKNLVERGRKGENIGISTGIKHLDDLICNIQPSSYYLLGAESSTGKSAFADSAFVINPSIEILNNKTDTQFIIDYYSLEISKHKKLIKFSCVYMWKKYGLLLDPNYVLSKGKNRISDYHYEKFLSSEKFIDKVSDIITIYDEPINPTGIYINTIEKLKKLNLLTKEFYNYNNKQYEKLVLKKNTKNIIYLILIDHIGLLKKENGLEKKANIDLMSRYAIQLRNNFNVSFLFISQFNRELSDMNRQKFKEVIPQSNDFKDTGNTYEDCEFCFTLFNPMKHNIMNYKDYRINEIGRRFRLLSVLKNRDGLDNINMGLNFAGEIGYFRYLPPAQELYANNELYKKMLNFNLINNV